jgi:hypothetical protein
MTDKNRRKRERRRRREERRKKVPDGPPDDPDWGRWITPGVILFFILLIGFTLFGVVWRSGVRHAHGDHADDGHAPVVSGDAR